MLIDPPRLRDLGWQAFFDDALRELARDDLVPARVATQLGSEYLICAEDGDLRAQLAGRLRGGHVRREPGRLDYDRAIGASQPTVGDWVAVSVGPAEGRATIEATLPRRTVFSRMGQRLETERQVLAANVDTVFVVVALRPDEAGEGPRRLARHARSRGVAAYLAMAHESGARPVLLLTKADLCPDPAAAATEFASLGAEVRVTSALTGDGLDALAPHLAPGSTVALVGLSGVGKSTLINALLGEERLTTRAVRRHGDGRHMTSRRELIQLPGGGLIVDTPGLRELQLWDSGDGLDAGFADIAALAEHCRFRDCRHTVEPGCAVLAAIAAGTLDATRLANRGRLERELERLERLQAQRGRLAVKRKRRALAKVAFDGRRRGPGAR